jgi:hypothetical protein
MKDSPGAKSAEGTKQTAAEIKSRLAPVFYCSRILFLLLYFFSSVAVAPTADVAAGADAAGAAGAATGAAPGAAVSAVFWPQADNARASKVATSAIRFILVSLDSLVEIHNNLPGFKCIQKQSGNAPKIEGGAF